MIKTVIFDLDGTLLNTLGYLSQTLNKILEFFGLDKKTDEQIRSYMGDGAYDFVVRALPQEKARDEDFCQEVFQEYLRQSGNRSSIEKFDGVDKLLCELKSKGLILCVLSNKTHEPTVKIINDMFPNIFEIVLGYKVEFGLKPNPGAVNFIAEQTNSKPEEILFVGDGEADTLVAKNANVKGVGALWGYRTKEQLQKVGCENFANSPSDVLRFI